ncbi:hypothetical protein ARMSODRAFT_112018 [Armillaria solidipes]|uniref:Uncharacterized protein n=1 Tax=Armillaria solidipes TaxID=1076256 RepID=A0A2H3C0Q7_9AGAR|nr:hypothetical protein ARMSODRAFT_112018 [Armillaria solidipes]
MHLLYCLESDALTKSSQIKSKYSLRERIHCSSLNMIQTCHTMILWCISLPCLSFPTGYTHIMSRSTCIPASRTRSILMTIPKTLDLLQRMKKATTLPIPAVSRSQRLKNTKMRTSNFLPRLPVSTTALTTMTVPSGSVRENALPDKLPNSPISIFLHLYLRLD